MQARLRAQLGDRSKYSGERRRRSVVVASIVLTITDPLRGLYHFWNYLQAALIRSCGASFAIFIVFQCFRSIASLPCKIVFGRFDSAFFQEIILSSGVFRRETASGFYPWCNVVGPRKRVAEGLCGGRHGNSFPMTQSAQLHRQMRSIPRCSKAVFYVFVFDSIHDSATMQNILRTFPLSLLST